MCIDGIFLDKEGYYCTDHEEGDEEECQETDIFTGKAANELCGGGGGGTKYGDVHEEL